MSLEPRVPSHQRESIGSLHRVRPVLKVWQTQVVTAEECLIVPGEISTSSKRWMKEMLRNNDVVPKGPHTGKQPCSGGPTKLRVLPIELLTIVFEYLGVRERVYELPQVSKAFRIVARQRRFWERLELRQLIEDVDLPASGNKFISLPPNLYSSLKEYRQHFWIRHIERGNWPADPHVVDLSTCQCSERDVRRLLTVSGAHTHTLRWSYCESLDDECISAVTATLTTAHVLLRTIDISFSSPFSGMSLRTLLSAPCCASSLTSLDISCCQHLTDEALRGVLLGAIEIPSLLRLSCRGLSSLHAGSLASWDGITHHRSSLVSLDVSRCAMLDDEGLKIIAAICTSLKELNVSGCGRVTDGCFSSCFAESLPVLTSLWMDDCPQLSDHTLSSIVAKRTQILTCLSVERCSSLRGLFLIDSPFRTDKPSLPKNHKLVVSFQGCLSLVREAFRNSMLRRVLVEGSVQWSCPKSVAFLRQHRVLPPPPPVHSYR